MLKALKGCRFAGRDYSAGDIVPESAVDKKMLGALARRKILEIIAEKIQAQTEAVKPRNKAKK